MLIGLGDIKKFLIPELIKLEYELNLHVILSDKEHIENINFKKNSEIEINWIKKHYLNLEDIKLNQEREFNNIIAYLAIPPSQFYNTMTKFKESVDIFVLEKPWINNNNDLDKILDFQKKYQKKIIGVDHYLWKPVVIASRNIRREIEDNILQNLNYLEFILSTPEIDEIDRKYYWTTGTTIDFIPHVLSILYALFNFKIEITIENAVPMICNHATVSKILNIYQNDDNTSIRETFCDILMNGKIKDKVIHIHVV